MENVWELLKHTTRLTHITRDATIVAYRERMNYAERHINGPTYSTIVVSSSLRFYIYILVHASYVHYLHARHARSCINKQLRA